MYFENEQNTTPVSYLSIRQSRIRPAKKNTRKNAKRSQNTNIRNTKETTDSRRSYNKYDPRKTCKNSQFFAKRVAKGKFAICFADASTRVLADFCGPIAFAFYLVTERDNKFAKMFLENT